MTRLSVVLVIALVLTGSAAFTLSTSAWAQPVYSYPAPPRNIYANPWVGPNTPWVYYNGDWFQNGMLYYNFGPKYGWAPYYSYAPNYVVRPGNWYGPKWEGWYRSNPHYWENFHRSYPYWRSHHYGQRYDQRFYNEHHHGQGGGWHRGWHDEH